MNERFAGRFLLLRRLGTGGMGEVYLARDTTTGLECALKRLHVQEADLAESARREFEALTRVRHPAVVAVQEFGVTPDGIPYYTMEYVPGLPSDRALAADDRPALFYVAARVAHGLEVLHAANVVHGDLKPANLMVLPGDRPGALPRDVRLVDFGLATLIERPGQGHTGTAGYAAPEVVAGQAPTPSSDLYSLGATLYTILARRPPFAGDTVDAVLRRQRSGAPSTGPLEAAGTPGGLIQLILRLMAASPAERPRDAREVRRALESMHPAARRPLAERIEVESIAGREIELTRFEAWGSRTPVRPRLMILAGVAGAGKTALLTELAHRATLAGRPVFHLSAAAFEEPRATARTLVRRLAMEAGADAEAALGPSPTLPAIDDLERWSEAAAGWLSSLSRAGTGPVVLIDDAERLDDWSRSWMRRLISRPEPMSVAWLWARRRAERVPDDEAMMIATGLAERIDLEPLTREGLARLAAVRLGDTSPPALESDLWSKSGGHPGLAVDLLRRAVAAEAIVEDEAGMRVDEDALSKIGAPADYESSLLARCAALPPSARLLAEALAVWKAPLQAEEIARILPDVGAEAIEAVIESGLASRLPSGVQLWPPLLADRLAAELTPERRRELHRMALGLPDLSPLQRFHHLRGAGETAAALDAAARVLEQGVDTEVAGLAASLAEERAPDVAAEWHERAAKQFMERRLFVPAARHLRRALELEPKGPCRADRWVMLCRAAQRTGNPEEVSRIVDAARREELPAPALARMIADESMAKLGAGDRPAARERAMEALALAETSGEAEAEGVAAQTLGYLEYESNRISDAETWAARAMKAFESAGRPDYARAITLRSWVLWARGKTEEAEQLSADAIRSAISVADRHAHEDLQIHVGAMQIQLGRWTDATRSQEIIARIGIEDARFTKIPAARATLAIIEALIGKPQAARRHARQAIRLSRMGRPGTEPGAWRALALAQRIRGQMQFAERAIQRAIGMSARVGRDERGLQLLELAKIRFAQRNWAEARQIASNAMGEMKADLPIEGAFLTLLGARAAARLQQVDVAESELTAVRRWLEQNPRPYVRALELQLGAELAFAKQRWDDGLRLGQEALDAFTALPAPHDRASAVLDMAELIPIDQSTTPVAQWLEEAAESFKRVGDRGGRERALAQLVERLKVAEPSTPTVSRGDRGLLERVSWLLNSLTDMRELAQRAMRMVVEQLEADRGVLLLIDRETGQMDAIAEHGAVDGKIRNEAMRYSRRVVQRVTESGGAVLIEDAPSDPRGVSDSVKNLQLRSIVCVPLFLGGAVRGAAYLDSKDAHHFGEADRGLLEGFAHLMAVALETARGHEEIERVRSRLEDENLSLRQEVGSRFQHQNLIGSSSEMRRVLALIEPAAQAPTTVLITGENGTGKELVARILHHSGPRRKGPFVSVNCGAIPQSLVESELFGILNNVATQVRARDGRFRQADGGTLFLDEIGEMPPAQQVALLSAIANREVTPVGGSKPISVDVRIIAATNQNLRRLVEEQRFREDLYYRLAVIELEMPPLRERKADIPALARYFVQHFAEAQQREMPKLSPDFMAVLMQSDWRGNVRELQNYIERVVAMNPGQVVRPDPLPRDLQERAVAPRHSRGRGLVATVGEVERRMVTEALQRAGGNQSQAARILGLTEQSLRYRLRKYGLAPRENRRVRENRR